MTKLIQVINPFVEDPLGAFQDGTAGVMVSHVSVALKVEVVPEGHGAFGWHNNLDK